MAKQVAKLFDIECAPDWELIHDCFDQEYLVYLQKTPKKQLKFEEWVDEFYGEGARGDFLPLIFHKPVAIAVGAAYDDGTLSGPQCLYPPEFQPIDSTAQGIIGELYAKVKDLKGTKGNRAYSEALVRFFWEKAEKWDVPVVSFNGRGYDFPVLENWALRLGIEIPWHFQDNKKSYRHRYGRHIDLMEQLQNYGAVRRAGRLDWYLKAIGSGGKGDVNGGDVKDLWEAGKYETVETYCVHDVAEMHVFFERWRKVTGWKPVKY